MSKRLIGYDPATGLSSWYEKDGDNFNIGHTQDVSKHLDYAKRLRSDPDYKKGGIKNDYYHFAHVPSIALLEIKKKYGLDWTNKEDLPKFEKVLSSSEYKHLRTVDRI